MYGEGGHGRALLNARGAGEIKIKNQKSQKVYSYQVS